MYLDVRQGECRVPRWIQESTREKSGDHGQPPGERDEAGGNSTSQWQEAAPVVQHEEGHTFAAACAEDDTTERPHPTGMLWTLTRAQRSEGLDLEAVAELAEAVAELVAARKAGPEEPQAWQTALPEPSAAEPELSAAEPAEQRAAASPVHQACAGGSPATPPSKFCACRWTPGSAVKVQCSEGQTPQKESMIRARAAKVLAGHAGKEDLRGNVLASPSGWSASLDSEPGACYSLRCCGC